jgi:uncharacterized membrane protein HdeD (DUF308 family)
MGVSGRATDRSGTNGTTQREVRRVIRRWAWAGANASVLVGLFGVLFPQRTLGAVALVVGIYFIVTGIGRVATAVDSKAPVATRLIAGILGAAVVLAGVLALNNPFRSIAALDVLVGVGLVVDGAACLSIAFLLAERGTRRSLVIPGIASVVAGAVVLVVQASTLTGLLFVAAVCFVVLGAATIVALIMTRDEH